jgi:hypothetical protein
MQNTQRRLWPIVTLTASALLLATHLLLPLNIDNDLYQAMGWNIARRSLVPYVGSWAHTLPGMPYIHALAIVVFGNTALGFRTLDVLVHLASALLMFSIARRFLGEFGAFVAATSITLYYVSEGFWLAGQPDGFAVFFILLGTRAYYEGPTRRRLMALAGVALAMAGMLRPTYALFTAALLVVIVLNRGFVWSYVLGAAACFFAFMLPYFFVADGFRQVYEAAIGFNVTVYGDVRTSYDLRNLLGHPLVIMALTGLVLHVFERSRTRRWHLSTDEWLLLLYTIAGFVSLYAMGKFLVYHFDPIFAVAAYGTGYIFTRLWKLIPSRVVAVIVLSVLAIVGVRRLYPFNLLHIAREAASHDRPLLESCYAAIKDGKDFGYERETELVQYVRIRHPRAIEFASITPALLWRSEVPQASRFTMIHAIGMRQPGRTFTPFQIDCQKEYLRDLQRKRPDLFILATEPHDLAMFSYQDPASIVRQIPGVDSLLTASYVLDSTIGPFQCYRLR